MKSCYIDAPGIIKGSRRHWWKGRRPGSSSRITEIFFLCFLESSAISLHSFCYLIFSFFSSFVTSFKLVFFLSMLTAYDSVLCIVKCVYIHICIYGVGAYNFTHSFLYACALIKKIKCALLITIWYFLQLVCHKS